MTSAEVSIVVTTFERPNHLRNCLRSLENQDYNPRCYEVIVADDGSRGSETEGCVAEFATHWPGRTLFLTQPKKGFRLATCRNKAAAVSSGRIVIFLDGDCVVPPQFVRAMVDELRPRTVVAGDCYRLTQEATESIDLPRIDTWDIEQVISHKESKRLRRKAFRARIYSLLSVPMRPRLTGCAFACHREDLLSVNGFDENFVGWGFEDRDIQRRFLLNGIRTRTVLHRVKAIHLWHPFDPTFSRNGEGTANRTYYEQGPVTPYCQRGMSQYLDGSVACQIFDRPLLSDVTGLAAQAANSTHAVRAGAAVAAADLPASSLSVSVG
ncbi:glycosyltransferase [Blastopirellula marina]|nr:glycosyltransferase [Blastopirellula marina]